MPHQCVRCNTFYEDGAQELLKGCSCGGRLFFYIKKSKLEEAKKTIADINLTDKDKEQIEKDVYDIVGTKIDKETPIVLDIEAIRVLKPGQYHLDLVRIFKNEPLIIKLEEGKYMIDLIQSFKMKKEKDNS